MSTLSSYVLKEGSKMIDEVRRHSFGEVTSNRIIQVYEPQSVLLGQETFLELRQSFMHLGDGWDEGRFRFIFEDEKQTSAIALRVRLPFPCNTSAS